MKVYDFFDTSKETISPALQIYNMTLHIQGVINQYSEGRGGVLFELFHLGRSISRKDM